MYRNGIQPCIRPGHTAHTGRMSKVARTTTRYCDCWFKWKGVRTEI